MLARNSDLYLEVRASCVAFSSSAWRACSTSAFLRSTSAFCCARRRAFSCSSALVVCSSSWRLPSSLASDCDCSRRPSVRVFAELVEVVHVLAAAVGVAREELQARLLLARVHHVEDAVLRADDRCQLGEDHLRDREEIALALEHAGELGEVRLEPVLLRVLE